MAESPVDTRCPDQTRPMITLTTDFGLSDTYVAQMKGIIAQIAPDIRVIDGTHLVPPQDILAGALAIESLMNAFPANSIHVGVVDPGVGSDRAAVAVATPNGILVGPDNGLFTLALEQHPPTDIVRLTDPQYHRQPVSDTFHGRDIFAPVAAHLANGVPLRELGEPVNTLVNLNLPAPALQENIITARVLCSDRFGNLITNLRKTIFDTWLAGRDPQRVRVKIARQDLGPLRRTFAQVRPGEPLAYFGSGGRLEIAVRNGDAKQHFGDRSKLSVVLEIR